jgi:UDP-N-acetylglucosamine 2-epimerase (non-hydrolysing)
MKPEQNPSQVCSKVLESLDTILEEERPDLILVQGDTTTAMAGALAGFHRRIPVGHVEAGLRSGDSHNPYPEEMNRRLITRLASFHFAATADNRRTLLSEGVGPERVFVTGNPVVDSLTDILTCSSPSEAISPHLRATEGMRRIVLTTHRRESFGEVMAENLRVLRRFVERHTDVALLFPVHPNPAVVKLTDLILSGHSRIRLVPPLNYPDFIMLLSNAWVIVSDSGGVQEVAPTLRKPLLILRENTERPEVVESGIARLVGGSPYVLETMLEDVSQNGDWTRQIKSIENPFGQGDSGKRIAKLISQLLGVEENDERCQITN